jgi:hypothetical protein
MDSEKLIAEQEAMRQRLASRKLKKANPKPAKRKRLVVPRGAARGIQRTIVAHPRTELSPEALLAKKVRQRIRKNKNQMRYIRRKHLRERSSRYQAKLATAAARRIAIAQRKAERELRLAQEAQFQAELAIKKPTKPSELKREQEIALAYAQGYQDGLRVAAESK